jgi:hypothetical protein
MNHLVSPGAVQNRRTQEFFPIESLIYVAFRGTFLAPMRQFDHTRHFDHT